MPSITKHSTGIEFEKHQVDKESQARTFRASWRWRKTSERDRMHYPLCPGPFHGDGRIEVTRQVHHIYSVAEFYHLRLHPANRIPLCNICHNKVNIMANRHEDTIAPFRFWIERIERDTGRKLVL